MRQGNGDAGFQVHANGTVADAIAAVLKREGVGIVFGYPRNQILEACARIDIRTVIVRQERTGLHMADAVSRMSKGGQMGVFVMQQGPGAENAFGGVAQAFADSVPVLVMPQGYALSQDALAQIRPGQSQDLVVVVLGSPMTVNAFDEGVAWYYVETKVSQTAFGMKTINERTVLAIYFDKNNRVADKAVYTAKDGKLITIEGRKTPSYGEDKSFIDSLIDSI